MLEVSQKRLWKMSLAAEMEKFTAKKWCCRKRKRWRLSSNEAQYIVFHMNRGSIDDPQKHVVIMTKKNLKYFCVKLLENLNFLVS